MNVESIGINSGIVWRQLASEHRKWEYAEVKAATGLADRDMNAAIGWLAREGKIQIEESKAGRKTIIYLTLCDYFG